MNRGGQKMSAKDYCVTVQARPKPLVIGPSKTAILVVDMQNDFGATGGMFDRAGVDIRVIQRVVEPIAKVLCVARAAHIPVIYIKMEHQPDLSDTGPTDGGYWVKNHRIFSIGTPIAAPDGSASRILVKGTWNTDILKTLAPEPNDIVISKHRYSGFYQTRLDDTLKARRIKHLIVIGCTTSVCVESTVRDAAFRDYSCIVLGDCTAEPLGHRHHDASLALIEKLFGWVSSSQQFIDALGAVSPSFATTDA
jgi:ureidoacrylate peracid hydrolase